TEQRQPVFHQRARNHRHTGAAAAIIARTDREMQRLDIGRQLLLERERRNLLRSYAALVRQFDLGHQHVAAGHDGGDAPAAGLVRRLRQRAHARRAERLAVLIGKHPAAAFFCAARQLQNQPFRHDYSVPNVLSMGRTWPLTTYRRLYKVKCAVPIVMTERSRKYDEVVPMRPPNGACALLLAPAVKTAIDGKQPLSLRPL